MDDKTFELIKDRFDKIDQRFENHEVKTNENFDKIYNKIDSINEFRFKLLGVVIAVSFITSIGVVLVDRLS